MVKQRMEALIDKVADMIEQYVEVDRLLEICATPFTAPQTILTSSSPSSPMKIAVASDASFNFVYRENIDRLKELGEVTCFSPLTDQHLPAADLVYLPGGYPELFAYQLQRRKRLMAELKEYAEEGGKVLAECGGMMYLTQSILTGRGKEYAMCGVLPFRSTLAKARLHLGYRRMELGGIEWKGHEFHYSELENPAALPSIAALYRAKGGAVDTPVYRYKNVIAGYTHWYWGENNVMDLWKK